MRERSLMFYADFADFKIRAQVTIDELFASFRHWVRNGQPINAQVLKEMLATYPLSPSELEELFVLTREGARIQSNRPDFEAAAEYAKFYDFLLEKRCEPVSV